MTVDGLPVVASGFGAVRLEGQEAACAQCHRRSGYGSIEGGVFIPPITAPFLFEGRQLTRNDRFRAIFMLNQSPVSRARIRDPLVRPPYDADSLALAIREGTDAGGNALDPMMPRYELSPVDQANLSAYLRTLSAEIAPGIDEVFVHLATVIDERVDQTDRSAMISTMNSFIDWFNERMRGNVAHSAHALYSGSQFLNYVRLFKLHVWALEGDESTWSSQLESHINRQPVFALVGGLVEGPWQPVARFCEQVAIPCIFPNADLLGVEEEPTGGYTVYFSRGLELEADLIAHHVATEMPAPERVLILHDTSVRGRVPAARLEAQLRAWMPGIELERRELPDSDPAAGLNIQPLEHPSARSLVSIWGSRQTLQDLSTSLAQLTASEWNVTLPSATLEWLADDLNGATAQWVLMGYPYALPTSYHPDAYRARAWMMTRGIDRSSERIQLQTYYALSMFRDAFTHLRGHFHRDFFLELLEHEIQGSPNPGVFEQMALGPEQRVVSKSGYVVRPDPEAPGGVRALSNRIVP